jgi:Carbohydrate binding module (family 6)/Metallo-peptidase family M12B Reprolysin-like
MKTIQRTVCAVSTMALSALWLAPGCAGVEPGDESEVGWDAAEGDDVTLTGTLEVSVVMYSGGHSQGEHAHGEHSHDMHHSRIEYLLYRSPDDRDPVRLDFDDALPFIETGDELTVAGRLESRQGIRTVLVDELLSIDKRVDVAQDAEIGQASQKLVVDRAPKHHKTAVLLVGQGTMSAADAKAMLNPYVPGSAAAFIGESSGLMDTFEGVVFSYPQINTSACSEATHGSIRDAALAAFTAAGNNVNDYTNIAYVYGVDCGFYAKATVNKPGSSAVANSFYSVNSFGDCRVAAHELGHNLGFLHAHSTACGGSTYKANRAGCTDTEYGNPFDVMGSGGCSAGSHYSIMQKRYAGYLTACEDVTAGGSATFNLSPAEGSCGMRSLRIPIAGENNYYYLEYRKASAGEFGGVQDSDRVLLNVSNDPNGAPDAYVLDSTPATSSLSDAWLAVGTTYTLPGNVKIKVESLGEVAKINVTMPAGAGAKCRDGATPASSGGVVGALCGPVADKTYQAEKDTWVKTCTVSTAHAGYGGTGFMDFGGAGSIVEWKVDVPRYGQYKLAFRYANGSGGNRTSNVSINDQFGSLISVPFSPTGSWATWKANEITVTLKKGINKVRVTSVGEGPNLDQVLVKKL